MFFRSAQRYPPSFDRVLARWQDGARSQADIFASVVGMYERLICDAYTADLPVEAETLKGVLFYFQFELMRIASQQAWLDLLRAQHPRE